MLSSTECAKCFRSIDYGAEDWLEVDIQMGDVTVKVMLCEEHAAQARQNAARKIIQAV